MKEFIKEGIEKDRHRGLMESELIGRVHAAFTGEFGAIFESLERILVSLMPLLVNLEGILVSLMLLLVNLELLLVKHRNEYAFFLCYVR
jgi:hypothetical protein